MLPRKLLGEIRKRLESMPAVALHGARQVGKTTLAREVQREVDGVYFDLEDPRQAVWFEDPFALFREYSERLIIIDEAQRRPELFPILRVAIDEDRRNGRFLLLGSASPSLSRQSNESLAGRLATLVLHPLTYEELGEGFSLSDCWVKGGFPPALLGVKTEESLIWRRNYLLSFFERDLQRLGFGLSPERMTRYFNMLAHVHGQLWNASLIGRSLDVGVHTANRYLEALSETYLAVRIIPYFANLGKRLRKSPKVYISDSGLLHAILNISTRADLLRHPCLGFSWEGFVLQQVRSVLTFGWETSFWRTEGGAEIDILLLKAGKPEIGIEAKANTTDPRPRRGFHQACNDLEIEHRWVVYPGEARMPLAHGCELLPLVELVRRLRSMVEGENRESK